MRYLKILFLALAVIGVSNSASATPLLNGETVQYQYLFSCITCNYGNASNGNYVVGPGVEVANVADSRATMDISDTNLFVDYLNTGSWTGASFNGFRITDILASIPAFTGVTINPATNMVGFNASRITFDADNIWVNWQGLSFDANTVVSLDIQSVPEPGSLALLGMALVGVARLRQRKA